MADEIRQQLGFDASQTFTVLEQLNAAFAKFGAALEGVAARMDAFNQAGAKVDEAVKTTNAATREAARIFEQTRTPLEKYQNTIAKLNGLLQQGAISQDTHSRAVKQAGEALSGTQKTAELAREGARIFEQTRTPQEKYANTAERLNTLLQQGAIDQDTHNRALKQSQEALDGATKTVDSYVVSWRTLGRVVMTQFIVRAMSMMRDAFREAYQSALEFSNQVGEIRAINPERNFGEIAADIRQLSDAFNQPLSKMAEAQYQTISDQFVTAADRANILTVANMLAKTGADDLTASAQLLTGALNAYGESSDMAGLRAAQFFESVNLGRFRMSELGTALGRVQSIAHEVGVSMEELQASLIAITIGGVKANEAATQLRGVMTALLKPSEGMKAALRTIGVESGEAAIATWGFQGTLKQLEGITNGSASEMAKLFQNVRGLAGVLRLATTGAEKYDEAMQRLRTVDQATLGKKFEEFVSTDAEKLTRELNKLANFFTAEFGAKILNQLNTLIQAIGGANGLLGVLRVLTGELPKDALLMASFAGAAALLASKAKLATFEVGSLRGALTLLAGIEVAKVAGTAIGEAINTLIEAPQKALRDATQQELDIRKQQTEAAIRESERKNNELLKALRQSVSDSAKLYLQDADHFKAAMKIEEQVVKLSFDRIMQARQRLTHELVSAAENAEKQIADISRKSAEIQTSVMDREFNRWAEKLFGGDLGAQFDVFRRQALTLADEAARLQGSAKDANQAKLADDAWKRAEAYVKQTQQIASQTKDAEQLRQVEKLIDDLDQKRISALRQQAKTQTEVAREAEQRAYQAEAHNLELEELRRGIEEKLKATSKDAEGNVQFKGKEQFKKDLTEADRMVAVFLAKLKEYGREDFIKPFLGDPEAFEALRREAERALASADIKKIEVAPDAIADLASTLQRSLESLKLTFPVLARIEKLTGLEILSDGFQKVIDAYEKKLNAATARAIRQPQLIASQMAVTDEYKAARNAFVGQIGGTLTPWEVSRLGQAKATETLIERTKVRALAVEFDQLMRSTEISDQAILKLKTDLQSINWDTAFLGKIDKAKMATELQTMVDALEKRRSLLQQQKENAPLKGEEQDELRRLNQQIDAIRNKKAAQNESAAQTERDTRTTQVAVNDQFASIGELIDRVNALAASWGAVANAAGAAARLMAGEGYSLELQSAAVGGLVQRLAAGGIARAFDAGGFSSRGIDTVPAMLSPGEFVINAASARRFASQLTAINAGIKPVFRSEGGGVTTNIGDINVTVSGGGSSHQTARSIAVALKRELRRGTSTL